MPVEGRARQRILRRRQALDPRHFEPPVSFLFDPDHGEPGVLVAVFHQQHAQRALHGSRRTVV
jgi:hypothetical protein